MKAILTEGKVGEFVVVRAAEPNKPIPNVLLLFPFEDRDVEGILRAHGNDKLADKIARYWERVDEWK